MKTRRRALILSAAASALGAGCGSVTTPSLQREVKPPEFGVAAPRAEDLLAEFSAQLSRFLGPQPYYGQLLLGLDGANNAITRSWATSGLPTTYSPMLEVLLSRVDGVIYGRMEELAKASGKAGSPVDGPMPTARLRWGMQEFRPASSEKEAVDNVAAYAQKIDGSGTRSRNSTVGDLVVAINALDTAGFGGYGLSEEVRIVFQRLNSETRSVAFSILSVAGGRSATVRVAESDYDAIKLASAVVLVKLLSRIAMMPLGSWALNYGITPDTIGIERAVAQLRIQLGSPDAGPYAAIGLNTLRAARCGLMAKDPVQLVSETAFRPVNGAWKAQLAAKNLEGATVLPHPVVAELDKRGFFRNDVEREFAVLFAAQGELATNMRIAVRSAQAKAEAEHKSKLEKAREAELAAQKPRGGNVKK
jgi:hypothetical protein